MGQDTPFHDAPLVQTWGRAEGENLRTFLTAGIDVGDDDALYAQANYADTFGRYRFFFRDLNHITLRTLREEYGYDGLPAGFTPFFDRSQIDTSFVAGIRGSWDNGMDYDLSAGYGFNELDFLLSNTINQSLGLGPDVKPPQRNFDLGLQVESGTVPPTHPLALAAGGSPLTEEKATNLSLGFVAGFGGDIALTADLYRIDIEGRIFKTQNLPTIDPATGVGSNVQFFTNALGLEVSGLDLVMTSSFNWGASGAVTDLNLAYNRNMVDVVKQRAVNGILPVSEASVEDIEESYPRDRLTLSAGTSADAGWTLLLRLNYLGSHYDERGRINGVDGGPPTRKISSTIFFDAEFGYELYDGLTLVLGAANLFDEYADWIGPPWANRLDVGLPFGRRTAANYEGGSWYARLNYVF